MAIISTDNLIKQGGAFFTQNFRRSNLGGVANGYGAEMANDGTNTKDDINYGSDFITPIISDYIHLKGSNYWGSDNDIQFSVYQGEKHLGLFSKAENKLFFYGSGYNIQNTNYGIIQDTYGEIVWSHDNFLGRTKKTTCYINVYATTGDMIISIPDGDTINFSGLLGAVILKKSYGVTIEYVLIGDRVTSSDNVYNFTGGQSGSKERISSNDSGVLLLFYPNWKSETGKWGAMLQFEDAQFVCKENKIFKWKESDASDFAEAMQLPYGYEIVRLTRAKTGSGDKIFILANRNNRGTVFVWDGASETYDYSTDFDEPISTGIENYVAVDTGIYYTNGYDKQLITSIVGLDRKLSTEPIKISDIKLYNDFLLFTSNVNNTNSLYRRGLYIYDLTNQELSYVLPYNKHWYERNFGAVIIDRDRQIYFSHDRKVSKLLSTPSDFGNIYQFLFIPENSRMLKLSELYLNIDFGMYNDYISSDTTNKLGLDIIIRCYDFREPFSFELLERSTTAGLPSNQIDINYSNINLVNKKIEFLGYASGVVGKDEDIGKTRNIIDYDNGVITLDEPITYTPNVITKILLSPLRKIGYKEIRTNEIPIDKLKIPLLTQPMFKKALFEIEFRTIKNGIIPKINSVELILEQNDL